MKKIAASVTSKQDIIENSPDVGKHYDKEEMMFFSQNFLPSISNTPNFKPALKKQMTFEPIDMNQVEMYTAKQHMKLIQGGLKPQNNELNKLMKGVGNA